MSEETIKRVGDFKFTPNMFRGAGPQQMMMDGKVGRGVTDYAWLESFGLVVRYSERKVALVTPGTVAAAAIEMARDIPAMRAALLEALIAMGPAEGGAAAAVGG